MDANKREYGDDLIFKDEVFHIYKIISINLRVFAVFKVVNGILLSNFARIFYFVKINFKA
jgi:hypothetical protein